MEQIAENGQPEAGGAAGPARAGELPLLCPACLTSARAERPVGADGRCAACGVVYPWVDGVPVLLADADTREALAGAGRADDARTAFYQEYSEYLRGRPAGHEALEGFLAQAPTHGVVLEVGSGQGAFRDVGGADYCALDYSLAHLRNHLGDRRRVCASAEAIPLASGSCRFVFSVATLEHVPRPDLAFREIDRVLALGGIAYLAPAWHCRDWAADGLPVRPYRDLTLRQKLRKAAIPLRDSLAYRGATQVPHRVWRRAVTNLAGGPTTLRYRPLAANYEVFWMSDSDACASIDSHEAVLFFESRGYEVLRPAGGALRRLLFRSGPLVVRKRG